MNVPRTILFVVTILATCAATQAQVLIAPTAVYLGDQRRTTSVTISNPSMTEREVRLSLEFGYPVSDSAAMTTVVYGDTAMQRAFACDRFVSVFPKRFVLKPGQRQVVRITASAPGSLEPGMYWTRLVVTTLATAQVGTDTTGRVGARLNFTYNQALAITYKRGDESVEVTLGSVDLVRDGGKTVPVLPLNVEGRGPFIGSIRGELRPTIGGEATLRTIPVSAYRSARKRIGDLVRDVPAGSYILAVSVSGTKADTDASLLLRSNTATAEVPLTINGDGSVSLR